MKINNSPYLFYGFFSLLGACLVIICTYKYGIALTHDSGYYMYAAKMLWKNGAYLSITNKPLTYFPPLLSSILSFANLTTISISRFTIYFNALCLFFTIFASGIFADKIINSNYLKVFLLVTILFSVPLFLNFIFLRTEGLFILLILLLIFSLAKYLESEKYIYLLLSILLSILIFYQRHAGIILTLFGFISILLFSKQNKYDKYKSAAIYAVVSFSFIALWLIRNYILSNNIDYLTSTIAINYWVNVTSTINVISSYFLPDEINVFARISILLVIFGLLFFSLRKQRFTYNLYIHLLLLFCFIYTTFIFLVNTQIYFDPEEYERYLSPIYIPLILLCYKLVDHLLHYYYHLIISKIAIALLCIWMFYPILRFTKNFNQWYSMGAGYTNAFWRQEKILAYIRYHNLKGKMWSNNPLPIISSLEYLASSLEDPSTIEQKDTSYIVMWSPEYSLTYLNHDTNKYYKHFTFQKIYGSLDGTIYRLIPKPNQ